MRMIRREVGRREILVQTVKWASFVKKDFSTTLKLSYRKCSPGQNAVSLKVLRTCT